MYVHTQDPLDAIRGARCPVCANTHGIRDGGPAPSGTQKYDVLHDTFGLLRCPHCGHRAGAAQFRLEQQRTAEK